MSSGQVTPSIGIIGSGHIGAAFARALARAGVSAIANSRGPESLTALVTELGGVVRAGTREEVAAQDIVLVAVPWPNLPAALSDLPEFGGRIVIEANNAAEIVFDPADPSAPPVFRTPDLHGQLSSELLRASCRVRGSSRRSTTCPRTSFLAIPRRSAGVACYFTQATMPIYSGDNAEANAQVGAPMERPCFFGMTWAAFPSGANSPSFPVVLCRSSTSSSSTDSSVRLEIAMRIIEPALDQLDQLSRRTHQLHLFTDPSRKFGRSSICLTLCQRHPP